VTFERPELLAIAPLVVLVVSLGVTGQWRRRLRLVDAYGGAVASARLSPRRLHVFPFTRLAALVIASVSLTLAAAGPEAPEPPPASERPIDLIVAVDVSLSMTAEDVAGSRARRATRVLADVMEALPSERIGVAIFADWPYTLVPVTHDLDVIRFFNETLGPDAVNDRDQGTGLGAVVTHARTALDARLRPDAEPAILLISDGEGFGEAAVLDSVRVATSGGVRLWTAGIGTDAGATLIRPGSPGDALLDETGTPVVARMNAPLLREMAEAGGGRYFDVTDEAGLRTMLDHLAGASRAEAPVEGGPGLVFWLTLVALPLLLWEGTADSSRALARRGPR
jgi:Ca-activated chloride channel family protein